MRDYDQAQNKKFTYTSNFFDSYIKDSIETAYNFSNSFFAQKFPANDFYRMHSFHISAGPQLGLISGTSAGAGLALCYLSCVLNKKIPRGYAVTGELASSGQICRVGGIRSKLMAVKENNVSKFFVPIENYQEALDLNIGGIQIIPVKNIAGLVYDIWRI